MGAAKILGIELLENFNAPYLSVSVIEFWRKWHISLTSWFKDYLYIPLGGSRKGKVRKYVNKFIVFCISGLWHGASLTFLIWGGLNGFYQIIGEILQPVKDKCVLNLHLNRNSFGHKLIQGLVTFLLIDFSWIFFRATGLAEAVQVIKSICTIQNPWIFFDGSLYQCGLDSKNFWLMIFGIGILIFADFCKYKKIRLREFIVSQDYWFRWLLITISICSILVFGVWGTNYEANGFLYFQF